MKKYLYIFLIVSLIACSQNQKMESVTIGSATISMSDSIRYDAKPTVLCDLLYDTISDESYFMHKLILDKFYNKVEKGYAFTTSGDTVNSFLHNQDIAAFVNRLNPQETGFYRVLTNKVIYLILENDAVMMDYALSLWPASEEKNEYFFYHIANPICINMPVDSIITLVENKFGEPNDLASLMKKRTLENLNRAKNNIP